MPKFKPQDASPPVELTPARKALADLQRQRANTLATVSAESADANRLERVADAVGPARQALAQFDAEQAAAMANWARGVVTGLPQTASARRAELAGALADHELASAAAKVAQAGFQANAERARRPIRGRDQEIRKAAKIVALEEASKLLPEITAAIATAETLRHRLDAARAEVATGLEFGSTEFSEVGSALHRFDNARGLAEARPHQTIKDDWKKFTSALQQDAAISFDDAQAMVVSATPFSPSAPDPVIAAALAAASFPSTGVVR